MIQNTKPTARKDKPILVRPKTHQLLNNLKLELGKPTLSATIFFLIKYYNDNQNKLDDNMLI